MPFQHKGSFIHRLFRDLRRNPFVYVLVLPGMAQILLFDYSTFYYLQVAFKDYNVFRTIADSPWVGFENFTELFASKYFLQALSNTLVISGYQLAFGFFVPVFIAILVNELRLRFFARTVQSLLYLPHFLSWVIVGGLFATLLSPSGGLVNVMLGWLGIDPIYFMANSHWFRAVLVITDIWKEAGWNSIIYLAAIAGISAEQYESATVDGANRWQKMLYITLPSLVPAMLIVFLLQVSKLLKLFEQVFVMYNPVVASVSETLGTYVYQLGIVRGEISFATATGIFNSIVSLVLVVGANYLIKRIQGSSII